MVIINHTFFRRKSALVLKDFMVGLKSKSYCYWGPYEVCLIHYQVWNLDKPFFFRNTKMESISFHWTNFTRLIAGSVLVVNDWNGSWWQDRWNWNVSETFVIIQDIISKFLEGKFEKKMYKVDLCFYFSLISIYLVFFLVNVSIKIVVAWISFSLLLQFWYYRYFYNTIYNDMTLKDGINISCGIIEIGNLRGYSLDILYIFF